MWYCPDAEIFQVESESPVAGPDLFPIISQLLALVAHQETQHQCRFPVEVGEEVCLTPFHCVKGEGPSSSGHLKAALPLPQLVLQASTGPRTYPWPVTEGMR